MPTRSRGRWRTRRRRSGVEAAPRRRASCRRRRALPQFENRFDGIAVRAPVPVGSLVDITLITERATSVEEINRVFEEEAATARYDGLLGVSHDQIVSSDIIQDPRPSIVDLTLTRVVDGDLEDHELVRQRVGVRCPDDPHGRAHDPDLTVTRTPLSADDVASLEDFWAVANSLGGADLLADPLLREPLAAVRIEAVRAVPLALAMTQQ